jgi:hypothetical protein
LQRPYGKDFVNHGFCRWPLVVCHWPNDQGRTTSDYFCGGVGGVAGFAGCDLAGEPLTPCSTELVPLWREATTDSVIEVTIKMMADQVVALDRTVAAPRGPKAVWLPMPPNAAAMSPLLPLWSNTTMIRNKQTAMWTIVINVTMSLTIPRPAYFAVSSFV